MRKSHVQYVLLPTAYLEQINLQKSYQLSHCHKHNENFVSLYVGDYFGIFFILDHLPPTEKNSGYASVY